MSRISKVSVTVSDLPNIPDSFNITDSLDAPQHFGHLQVFLVNLKVPETGRVLIRNVEIPCLFCFVLISGNQALS